MGNVRIVHNDTIDSKTKHALATIAAALDDMYWELNDADELDLPDDLYEDFNMTKGHVDELAQHIKHFLKAATRAADSVPREGES